jgi:predicted RNase H-like HicB family nuclease
MRKTLQKWVVVGEPAVISGDLEIMVFALRIQWGNSYGFDSRLSHQFYHQGSQRRMTMRTFTAYIEWDPETKLYIGSVPGIPGAHSQGDSLDELQKNLKEVLELCIEEFGELTEEFPRFVGLQQIEVSI